jgi:hypothetical protein
MKTEAVKLSDGYQVTFTGKLDLIDLFHITSKFS